jgi:hypothetical protein
MEFLSGWTRAVSAMSPERRCGRTINTTTPAGQHDDQYHAPRRHPGTHDRPRARHGRTQLRLHVNPPIRPDTQPSVGRLPLV